MPRDPVRVAAQIGLHITAEATISKVQLEVHRGFDEAVRKNGIGPFGRLLGHILIGAVGAGARFFAHSSIANSFPPEP